MCAALILFPGGEERGGGGGGGGTIDFSRNFFTFNFYGQLKHDIRSLRYVSRCFVEVG